MENTSLHWEYNLIFTSVQRKCTCYNAWTNFFLFCIDKNNKKTEGAAEKYTQKMLRLQHHMCITVVSYKHTCVAKPNLYFNSHCAGAYCNSRCNKIFVSLAHTQSCESEEFFTKIDCHRRRRIFCYRRFYFSLGNKNLIFCFKEINFHCGLKSLNASNRSRERIYYW